MNTMEIETNSNNNNNNQSDFYLIKTNNSEELLKINKQCIKLSDTLKNIVEDLNVDNSEFIIPVNVEFHIMLKIIEYLENYKFNDEMLDHSEKYFAKKIPNIESDLEYETYDDRDTKNINEWDKQFMSVDHQMLEVLFKSADILGIPYLICLCAKTITNQIENMNSDELREYFELPDDLTAEEKEELRLETEWIPEEDK